MNANGMNNEEDWMPYLMDKEHDHDIFEHGGVYAFTDQVRTNLIIDAFQKNNEKGGNWVQRMFIEMTHDEDTESSNVIDEFDIEFVLCNGERVFYKLDEVKPEDLFWVGWAFMQTAKKFGITTESLKKEWDEKTP